MFYFSNLFYSIFILVFESLARYCSKIQKFISVCLAVCQREYTMHLQSNLFIESTFKFLNKQLFLCIEQYARTWINLADYPHKVYLWIKTTKRLLKNKNVAKKKKKLTTRRSNFSFLFFFYVFLRDYLNQ